MQGLKGGENGDILRGIRNVRCIAIAPGYTATPMLTGMNQDALKAILNDVHLGRLVEPEEIARLIGHAVENEASCRVAQKAGFALEGITRKSWRYADGNLHDEHLHARLRTDQ